MLQFKVATQFGKTVLSPATQVRNVTSASMFPLANGHIGGRASVTESIKMVMMIYLVQVNLLMKLNL